MFKRGHMEANLQREFERPETFKEIRSRFEPVTVKKRSVECEYFRKYQNITGKRIEDSLNDGYNGPASTPDIVSSTFRSTNDSKRSNKVMSKNLKNQHSKSDLTLEVEKYWAERAKISKADSTSSLALSTDKNLDQKTEPVSETTTEGNECLVNEKSEGSKTGLKKDLADCHPFDELQKVLATRKTLIKEDETNMEADAKNGTKPTCQKAEDDSSIPYKLRRHRDNDRRSLDVAELEKALVMQASSSNTNMNDSQMCKKTEPVSEILDKKLEGTSTETIKAGQQMAPEVGLLGDETDAVGFKSDKGLPCIQSNHEDSVNQPVTPEIQQVSGKKSIPEENIKQEKVNVSKSKPCLPPKPNIQSDVKENYCSDSESDVTSTLDGGSSDSRNESGVFECASSANTSEGIDHNRIEYMLDVYMPYIKYQIKVTDVLDQLHFLSKREKDIILSKHYFVCASDAFELLIERIKMNEFKGKWQTFRHALDMKEFEYFKLLLDGKTELDHTYNRELLKLVEEDIKKRIDVQRFLDITFEKELLTEADKCHVNAQLREYGDHAAVEAILDKVHKHRKDWNTVLIEILQQDEFCLGDIAELFKDIEKKEPEMPAKGIGKKIRSRVRSRSNIEMDWRIRHLLRLDDVTSDLSKLCNTEYPNAPTSEDFKNLTLEIRNLRETVEKMLLLK